MRELLPIATVRDVATCGIVRCEVARGLRDVNLLRKFQARWDVMLYVPMDNKLWAEAEALLWRLDRQGINLPLQDVVIATCARRIGAVVLTHDAHFHQIPGIQVTDRIL
jgi:predicted nucleic acid-binding protein